MKKAIADRWIAALRSGKYKQGRKRLQNGRKEFCCLGVLCDILKAEVGGEWRRDGSSTVFKVKVKDDDVGHIQDEVVHYLPLSVQAVAGLKLQDPLVEKSHIMSLSELNDDKKLTFRQIANCIEKNWRNM